jgi:hypothetical protein
MQRIASLTTSDTAIRRETTRPFGLRRDRGRLLCCGSSTMLSSASTASPRLASTPVASATRLAGLLG